MDKLSGEYDELKEKATSESQKESLFYLNESIRTDQSRIAKIEEILAKENK